MDYIEEALKEAESAYNEGEIPVGAIIVKDGAIIARAHNLRETLKSPLAHAEIIAINMAAKAVGDWRLNGCKMYVTLEPCPMCAGAILQSRISEVNIGMFSESTGSAGTVINILQNPSFTSSLKVNWLYDDRCSKILSDFLEKKRRQGESKRHME